MKYSFIILAFFLLISDLLPSEIIDILIPPDKQVTIIEYQKDILLNNIKTRTSHLIIHNDKIKNIIDYYQKKLMRSGYRPVKIEDQNDCCQVNLQFIKNKQIISIQLSKKPCSDIEVIIYRLTSENISQPSFLMNNKKDNPGFDLNDIPRPLKSIRIASLLQSPYENPSYNIIYKSNLSKKQLVRFYRTNMKKHLWRASYDKNFFYNRKGYWMIFKKKDKQCLISILYMEELKSNIISIYYTHE